MSIQITLIAGFALSMPGCAEEPDNEETVIITQAENDAIRSALEEFKRHEYEVRASSIPERYLDCEAHKKLLGYGWKAVPYLIEQVARQEAVDAYVGSAIIEEAQVKTPEQVFAYNHARKSKVRKQTLAPWLLDMVLKEILSSEMTGRQRRRRSGYTQVFEWIDWWDQHKGKFRLETKDPLTILPLTTAYPRVPTVKVTVHDGLLDLSAVQVTHQHILERVAAELKVSMSFGEQEYLDVTTSVQMRSVTLEELLYLLGRNVSMRGFEHRKTKTGYRVGK